VKSGLSRCRAEVSSVTEQVGLVYRDLMGCNIMINNQNLDQAETHFRDAERKLRALNEAFADLTRKIKEGAEDGKPQA